MKKQAAMAASAREIKWQRRMAQWLHEQSEVYRAAGVLSYGSRGDELIASSRALRRAARTLRQLATIKRRPTIYEEPKP